jgi:hypothetical protein
MFRTLCVNKSANIIRLINTTNSVRFGVRHSLPIRSLVSPWILFRATRLQTDARTIGRREKILAESPMHSLPICWLVWWCILFWVLVLWMSLHTLGAVLWVDGGLKRFLYYGILGESVIVYSIWFGLFSVVHLSKRHLPS